jgi:folate-dependent phosphoribosylglycinamide formyltransferase PurN
MRHDIVVLAGKSPWTWALTNALRRHFHDVPIILEKNQSRALLLRRRIRRLGIFTVAGQVAFGVFAKVARCRYRRQERAILIREGLDTAEPRTSVISIPSVNDVRCIEILREMTPKVVVVSQTRILSPKILACIPARFINVHTGITPQYRGFHGAYWALVNGDAANCGVTIHVVDAGVDTGAIVAQARISPSASDSYFTYHWLQLAAALPLLIHTVQAALEGRLVTNEPKQGVSSRQYYHPTLFGYLWTGLRRGIW